MSLWLVIGAGVSGLGAAQFLVKKGHKVRVSERSTLADAKAQAFRALGVELKDGGHDVAHLDGVTNVVASPGLPPSHALLVEAQKRGLEVISEIDLALREYRGKVLAVTGTNGKSTTCAMLGHLLEKLGHGANVGGNFGDPPTAILAEGRAKDHMVLELSSYQLEQSHLVAPVVAIFTSFSFDHLARHGSLAGYLKAKWRIFAELPKGALALVPSGILELARREGLAVPAHVVTPRLENGRLFVDGAAPLDLRPAGQAEVHNQLNAAFAVLGVAHVTGKAPAELLPLLRDFHGLPHRCEVVGHWRGEPVINDSKSTNLESTLVALASQAKPVVLMMGGQGKGEPYAPLLDEKRKIAALITFGASGPEIAAAGQGHVPLHAFPTLKAALQAIDGIMETYGTGLLFSPGCASFDEFDNYAHRGEVFKAALASRLPDIHDGRVP